MNNFTENWSRLFLKPLEMKGIRPIILTFVFEFFSETEDEVKHSIRSLEGLTQVVNHLLVLLLFLGLTQKEKK